MKKKLLKSASSLLYKLHLRINKIVKEKSTFTPYQLHYNPAENHPKIIHVNGNFVVGGTSQLIVDIIENTSDLYTHQIIVPEYTEPLAYQPVSIKKFSITEMTKLYEYLKQEKPAIVHIHYWAREKHRYEAYALWYKAVFEICEELHVKVMQNINVPAQPFTSAAVVKNIFVSSYVLQNFYSNGNVNSSVIYPGSDFSHFSNNEIEALPNNSIGMVYRLDNDKLNAEAIEVFIIAAKKKPDITCYIIGDGYYYIHYKQRVSEENLTANFVFTGMISYSLLPEYYKKFAIFVAPVHDESFGQVTPFAMSMGLCIAGYNTGALSEILGYDDTLVEYDDTDSLAAIIADLLNNPQKRFLLGKANQQRAHENFSLKSMINKYKKVYAECLS